ncbi:MAG: D-alanine--D-alanine ligase family protein [Acidaminobacteraceae bacterium]
MINLAVFFGSRSVEHEVSIITAVQAMTVLREDTNLKVLPVYIDKTGDWYTGEHLFDINNYKNIPSLINNCQKINFIRENSKTYMSMSPLKSVGTGLLDRVDMGFPIVHGTYGEDGSLQGMLEHLQIPYVGCNVLAASTTMDKITSKLILQSSGVPVVDGIWFTTDDWLNNYKEKMKLAESTLSFPMIVKPADTGSSVGVTVVKDMSELEGGVNFVRQFTNRILIEKLVKDMREINISVLGDCEFVELSVCEEPILSSDFLSYDDKYNSSGSKSEGMSSAKREIPAKLSDKQRNTIEKMARDAFKVLDCSGVVRIDLMIEGTSGNIYINEFNTIPGSLAFYLWEATGKSFTVLLKDLIDIGIRKKKRISKIVHSNVSNILDNTSLGGLKK